MKLFHAKYAQGRPGGNAHVIEEDFYMPDVASVRRQIRTRGYWPISIREQKPPMFEWMDVRSKNWQVQLLRALRFQSATASAGTALLNIIEGETDKSRALAFLPTRTVLKSGGSFSEALRALRLMDSATMAIITAGERAGDLKGVIQHAIEHTEEKGKNLKVVMTALSWLSFDIINIIGSIWGAQFGFIPYLRSQGTKTTDPEAAARFEHALTTASWINGTLLVVVMTVCVGAVIFCGLYWMNRHKSDHYTSRMLMKIPIVSTYLRNVSMQDTCKLMCRLLTGKVPLAEAIDILIDSTVEPATRAYWTDCKKRILTGIEPARALGRWPLTKPEKDQIATIQAVDQLAEVYASIAEERGLMAKADQRRLTQTGVFLMMFLFGATVLTMIYLLSIQNQGLLDNLTGLKG